MPLTKIGRPSMSARRRAPVVPLLLLAASSVQATDAPSAQPRESEILTPQTGVPQTAYIDGELLRDETFVSQPGYRVTKSVIRTEFLHTTEVQAYEPLTRVHSKAALKVCANNMMGVCLFDDDGDGTFDRIAGDLVSSPSKLSEKVAYEPTNIVDPASRVVRHLSLAAIQGHQLTLRYREEIARPGAFASDEVVQITAPSTLPGEITFRKFHLLVLSIDGSRITYVVKPVAAP